MAIRAALARVWTALPVEAVEDSNGHIVHPRSLIKARQLNDDGFTWSDVTIGDPVNGGSLGGEVPVHHISGGGFTLTVPVAKGDEGIAIFSTLCLDGWWDKGGIQAQPDPRRHHLSDAMYLPGIRSNARKLDPAPSKSSAQLRTDDGKTYLEITKDKVNIVADADVTVTAKGKVTITAEGDVTVTSKGKVVINATGNVELNASGNIVLNGGSVPVARVGDTVLCPAGTGHITSGAAKVIA